MEIILRYVVKKEYYEFIYEEGIVVFKEKKMKYYVICVKKEKVVVYRQIGY